jgi:crotonobetainyl-CoA:carnitine CoA-transferase CaiB-like acyl-CoA transferase
MARPLAGYRVVDHGEFITAPYTAMLLGDLGAEVIKVERPGGGDRFRSFEKGSYGPQFQAFNRNKRSIVLDFDVEADRKTMRALLDTADVYVQNFRPGAAQRMGLGEKTLRRRHPRLVTCAISGFGPDGPYALRPAYDTVGQALSGFLSMFVMPEAPRIVGPATADSVTGLYAACGIMAALLERERTGRGRSVHVPMVAAMAHFSIEQYQRYFATGEVPGPSDRGRVSQGFALACRDGPLVAIHLSSPVKFWTGFVEATGHPELASDPRFATRMDRVRNHEALAAALRPIFAEHPRNEWLARLAAADVPHAPILGLDEALADPQVRHLDLERTLEHPVEGRVRTIRSPIFLDGRRDDAGSTAPPALDEHGVALRRELARGPRPSRRKTSTASAARPPKQARKAPAKPKRIAARKSRAP